jgi:ERCC4-type nuclease
MKSKIDSIIIDDREKKRINRAVDYYNNTLKLDAEITVDRLDYGDFIFNDIYCFEYKTYRDYIESVRLGRLYKQIRGMCSNTGFVGGCYVIVQADPLQMLKYDKECEFTFKEWQGTIARFSPALPVISCNTEQNCFDMMKNIVEKDSEYDFPLKPLKMGNTAFNIMAYCMTGIGRELAQLVVEELDISTVADLFRLNHTNLTSIRGIGDKRAEAILKQRGKLFELDDCIISDNSMRIEPVKDYITRKLSNIDYEY